MAVADGVEPALLDGLGLPVVDGVEVAALNACGTRSFAPVDFGDEVAEEVAGVDLLLAAGLFEPFGVLLGDDAEPLGVGAGCGGATCWAVITGRKDNCDD